MKFLMRETVIFTITCTKRTATSHEDTVFKFVRDRDGRAEAERESEDRILLEDAVFYKFKY